MKLDCKACKRTFEGDTELSVITELTQHLRDTPDVEHIAAMPDWLAGADRILTCTAMLTLDKSGIRAAMRGRFENLDLLMKAVSSHATANLVFLIRVMRDAILECGDESGVRDVKAARRLRNDLQESLRVLERKI